MARVCGDKGGRLDHRLGPQRLGRYRHTHRCWLHTRWPLYGGRTAPERAGHHAALVPGPRAPVNAEYSATAAVGGKGDGEGTGGGEGATEGAIEGATKGATEGATEGFAV